MQKIVGILSLVLLVTGLNSLPALASFDDTEGHWAEAFIDELEQQGVITGYDENTFGPDDFLSRAQLAKIAVLAFEISIDTEYDAGFLDLDSEAWYVDYVNAAEKEGLVNGYTDLNGNSTGFFGPDDFVNRAEAAKILVNASELEIKTEGAPHFNDVVIGAWYFDFVETAYWYSIVDGYTGGNYEPAGLVTRAEISKMTVKAESPSLRVLTGNPFTGATFWVDPESNPYDQIEEWALSRPEDAADMLVIAEQPTARWFGDWDEDIESAVDDYVTTVSEEGHLPVMVAYNIPGRDCGSFSAGGSEDEEAYLEWIQDFTDGVAGREAVVIVEPDALALDCMYETATPLIADAVDIFAQNPQIYVYLDAGHDNWTPEEEMAERLINANVENAQGFAVNVSNFYTNEENIIYATEVSDLIGGKHFILDTSRNGNGWNGEWCNPLDRSLGAFPSTNTGHALVDAFLWVKPPGESDGYCNGGPAAGHWWPEYALDLVRN